MAAIEIQDLGAVAVPNDADEFILAQAGTTYKVTRANIVLAEKTRAEAAEGVIAADLVSEAATRGVDDAAIAANLVTETNNRVIADALLIPLTYVDTDVTLAADSDTKLPSQKAIKAYVDSSSGGGAKTLENFSAAANLFPTTYGGNAITAGDRWVITVAGTLGTQVVAAGDSIEAKIDAAAVEADFAFFNTNVIVSSTTESGTVELATTDEAKLLADTSRAVVPSGVGGVLDKHVFQRTVVAATPFTADTSNIGVLGVTLSGARVINLPSIAGIAAASRPRTYYKVVDELGTALTANITVNGNGAETINGASSYVIAENYGAATFYNDGTNWFVAANKTEGTVRFASKTIVAASVATLSSVPVEIIPAPGAGKLILIISADATYVYDTAPYTGNCTLQLKYDTGVAIAESVDFLKATNSPCKPLLRIYNAGVGVIQAIENKAVQAITAVGDPTPGASLSYIKIFVSYRII